MTEINVKDARANLSALLDKVERGEEIIITRRGRKVAKLLSSDRQDTHLPSLKLFRSKIEIHGPSLSDTVLKLRNEETY